MSEFNDDFLRLHLVVGKVDIPLAEHIPWPPPERIVWDDIGPIREATDEDPEDIVMVRESYSQLTDEQRRELDFVSRGAEYRYAE